MLEFDTNELPKEVYFRFIMYRVKKFLPKPIRRFNCQEFKHIAKYCKGKKRCVRCGGERKYGKCGDSETKML